MEKTLKIALLLTAVDHMSEKVDQAVEHSRKKFATLHRVNSAMNSAGSLAITGGVAVAEFMSERIEQAEELEKAHKRLETTFRHQFKGYKEAAELAEQYADKASLAIGVDEESIMAVQSKLGIFKRVSNEANMSNGIFNRAVAAAFDMQAEGLGDASSNIVKMGKILNNPIKSINSLSRAGVIFTSVEKAKIAQLIQSGKLYDVQNMILKKVEGTMGGTAKATATGTDKMKVAWKKINVEIGKAVLPLFEKLTEKIMRILPVISAFIRQHPELVKWLGIAGAALLALGITLKVVAAAMTLVQLASGPVGWIILGIAALAFVLIKYWKPISAFFVRLWNGIKSVFRSTWNWIKNMFLNYTPMGLVIKHWDKIRAFFSRLWKFVKMIFVMEWNGIKKSFTMAWDGIKAIFTSVWNWVVNLGSKFYNAGKNIVTSIWKGIKAMVNKPVEAIKGMVKKIRNLLPFSPAKDGPLKDLHKIKLVETIAASINSAPLIKAMRGVAGDVAGYGSAGPVRPAGGGGGSVHITYAPVINGGSRSDITAELRKHSKELQAIVQEEMRKRDRTKF